jgi:uncharacterized protein (TIGR03435 family)
MNWSGFQAPARGRFEASHATVKAMVAYAYEVRDFYVSGGPGWTGTDRFEIEAKTEENATPEQMRLMLRTLLQERFKLVLHRETKDATVYQLVAAKGAPKLEEGAGAGFIKFEGRGQVDGHGVTMSGLASYLQTLIGQAVVDKTGLTATYNFKLTWMPDETQGGRPGAGAGAADAVNEGGPSIFTALQEQLGLKLEASKGPVETLVIDHAERPSEN